MNGQFYKNTGYQEPLNLATAPIGNVDNEQSYIENILRQNKGKKAKAYFSFTDSVYPTGTVDLMIIIGGKHSSNTTKVYEIAKKECKNCILIETSEELNKNRLKNISKIGIMAGASTPSESINNTVEKLKEIC